MLFGSNLLEVAIGMIFVYLLVSLLCSALSELIESLIRFRARDLLRGIQRLLDNPDLANRLSSHPLIKPMGERPSYIPARTFALALWNVATTEAAKGQNQTAGVTQDLKAIRDLIGSLDENKYRSIKASLLTLIDEAGNDINRARANIEAWFNDAMDRVSGWYKRRTHWILVVMGLIAASLLNIDTINVTRALWYNDTLRTSLVTAADTYIKTNPPPAPAPTQGEGAPKPEADAKTQAKAALDKVRYVRGEIDQLGLPIGWLHEPDKGDAKYKDNQGQFDQARFEQDVKAHTVDPRRFPDDLSGWLLKVLGLLVTGLAVSQGAPFWFDLLNKFMVIRSTIKPHEKSEEQPSKDKPAPETTKKQTQDKDKDE